MCKDCLEKFCENVMSLQAVRKLFHPQFKKFRKMQQEEITQEGNEKIVKNFLPKEKNKIHSF